MAIILVLYGTTEGHTRKIAEEIGSQLRALSHAPVLFDSANPPSMGLEEGVYDAAIVCGSVHQGIHQASLVHRVKSNLQELERIPSAFVSVSLAAALAEEGSRAEARRYADEFLRETGWTPDERIELAGALLYSKYDFFKRLVMKLIARSKGSDSDTSQDYEYTDWVALAEFVTRFLEHVAVPWTPSGTTVE
jgi:menaquinone-dependent protoporphyrinogen oxidase